MIIVPAGKVLQLDIAEPFAIGVYPVTFEEYERFVKANPRKGGFLVSYI